MFKQREMPKKGRPMAYVVLLVLVIVAMVSLRKCAAGGGSHVSRIEKSGGDTIDVAIEYSPAMCYTYADTLGGFNYDLLRLISQREHLPMKFHLVVTLQNALQDLYDGRVDVLVAQFPVTKENRTHLLFTDQVYIDRQVLVQLKDTDGAVAVKTQLDLAGDTVHVVKGSPMRERILNLSNEIGDSIYVKEEPLYGPEQLFLQVATGEIRYAVINRRIAADMVQRYPNVDISTSISFSQIQAWALSKHQPQLQSKFNAWIKAVKETPQYDALLDRYMMK
ncbi:MAG: transporter substrate-binding domain-containing protein [Muribaculaceae bacterium]